MRGQAGGGGQSCVAAAVRVCKHAQDTPPPLTFSRVARCPLPLPAAQVAAYCSLLDKDLRDKRKTAEADISDLLAASYASMFGAEAGRRLKAVPTAFYRAPPEALFGPSAAADFGGWKL